MSEDDGDPGRRLLERGADALTDAELVALLFGGAKADGACLAEARRLLARAGTLGRLARTDVGGLEAHWQLRPIQAQRLAAAAELARRMSMEWESPATPIESVADASRVFAPVLRPMRKEVFALLCLDTKGRCRRVRIISVGSLSASIVHPREVYAEAILEGAASILVAHNHPSGDPTPSPEDVAVTRKLASSGNMLGIPLIDHLIVGATSVVSMKELGLLDGGGV